jgi:MFS family permease
MDKHEHTDPDQRVTAADEGISLGHGRETVPQHVVEVPADIAAVPSQDGIYKWLVVGMLWFVCLFNYADRQAIFSVFPLLRSEMGLSDIQLGFVGSSFMLVYALALPFAGIVGDRVGRKTLILAGLVFWSLITLATALATEYWHLLLFRGLEGFGEAFYFPASMSLISDYHGRDTRSRAMAFHQSSVYAGTIAGGTLAGFLAEQYGWRSGFYVFGSLGIVLGVVLFGLLKEPRRGQADPAGSAELVHGMIDVRKASLWRSLVEIFANPTVWVLILVFSGANAVAAIFLAWMPTFLKDKFDMGLARAGFSATAYLQIASVLGVLAGGFLADRLARRYRGGRMLTQALGLFAGVSFLFLTGQAATVPVLIVALIGFGLCKGLYDSNIWASLYDVVKPGHRATALGIMNSIGWVGGFFGTSAIGAASAYYDMSTSLSATSLLYLLLGVLLCVGVWTMKSSGHETHERHEKKSKQENIKSA